MPIHVERRERHFNRFRGAPIALHVSTVLPGVLGERLSSQTRSKLTTALTGAFVVMTETSPVELDVSIDRFGLGAGAGWRCVTLTARIVRGGHAFAAQVETAERCLAQPGPLTNGDKWAGGSADLETSLGVLADPEGTAALQRAFDEALEVLLDQLDR